MHAYIPILVAAVATIVTMPAVIRAAARFRVLDRPNARSVHTTPIPRLGGIGITFGVMIAIATSFLLLPASSDASLRTLWSQRVAISGAAFFMFLVGLVDDVRSVSSRFKLLALIICSGMVCSSGAQFTGIIVGGNNVLDFGSASWAVTTLWICAVTVSVNFIDGLDGLAAGISLVAAGLVGLFLAANGYVASAVLPLALVGALLGFLAFNWHPARIFMGDGGSFFVGFVVSTSMVVANEAVGTMRGLVVPAMALSIPLADTALTLFRRRYQQRRSIFSAEQGHIHHNLLKRGLSHLQAVLTIYFATFLAVGVGLIALTYDGLSTLGGLALIIPILWGAFRFAGSVRTSEMFSALRTTRSVDRDKRKVGADVEALQLEFQRASTFAEWWQCVCRMGECLDAVSIELPTITRSGTANALKWSSVNDDWSGAPEVATVFPLPDRRSGEPPLQLSVSFSGAATLDHVGRRLEAVSRLMSECGLTSIGTHTHVNGERVRHRSATRIGVGAGLDHLRMDSFDGGAQLRVAVVHDFLYTVGGAERVVEQILEVVPNCDVFALFDFLPEEDRSFLKGKPVTTSFLQKMPFARRKHRAYLPLMPFAIEQLDLSEYDLVISSSYLAAKGVITGPDQLHVCYCHSPARYAWDLQFQYLRDAGLGFGPRGLFARAVLHYLRNWDARSALGVDHFIANSRFVARRIEKIYRRQATVIHPPVNTDRFVPTEERGNEFLAVSRMVPYKKTDLIVAAFSKMPHTRLVVIGDGPDFENVKQLAGPNVTLLGRQSDDVVKAHMQRARALVFAAEEDFGIVPVEALACGTPVIAFARGGVTETVPNEGRCILYDEQSVDGIVEAVERFEGLPEIDDLERAELRRAAERFSRECFRQTFVERVEGWVHERWPGISTGSRCEGAERFPVSADLTVVHSGAGSEVLTQ